MDSDLTQQSEDASGIMDLVKSAVPLEASPIKVRMKAMSNSDPESSQTTDSSEVCIRCRRWKG